MERSRLASPSRSSLLLAACAALAAGCGGGGGGGGATTGQGTGCTVTVSGDGASGVAAATLPCGFPKDLTTVLPAVEYDVTIPVGGSSTRQGGLNLLGPRMVDLPKAAFDLTGDAPLLGATSFTDQDLAADVGAGAAFTFTRSATAVWFTRQRTASTAAEGSFAVHLTSTTPAAVGDCASAVAITSLFAPTACYRVRGTAHAVLVPFTSLPGNTAAGTVTLDWEF